MTVGWLFDGDMFDGHRDDLVAAIHRHDGSLKKVNDIIKLHTPTKMDIGIALTAKLACSRASFGVIDSNGS